MKIRLSSCYLPPIGYFVLMMKGEITYIDGTEFFIKQSYRNRCEIIAPNGLQKLIIPVLHTGKRERMMDVAICNATDWKKNHWKSLEAAYRSSPYFEYYEDLLKDVFFAHQTTILDLNLSLLELLLKVLFPKGKPLFFLLLNDEKDEEIIDFREIIHPKRKLPDFFNWKNYPQVFDDRHPFHPNLSALDLLFNLGPIAGEYINEMAAVIQDDFLIELTKIDQSPN